MEMKIPFKASQRTEECNKNYRAIKRPHADPVHHNAISLSSKHMGKKIRLRFHNRFICVYNYDDQSWLHTDTLYCK